MSSTSSNMNSVSAGGEDGKSNAKEYIQASMMTHGPSLLESITSAIEEELSPQLQRTETLQEKEVDNDVTPFHLEFWRPSNIMSVEDTPFSNRYLVTLLVVAMSVPGNLARISFQELTNYENAYINYSGGTVTWINFSACFVMSWCNHAVGFWSHFLQNSSKTSMKQLALHTGLTTGFCGTFSTLSSAIVEIFFTTINQVSRPLPNDGYRVMEFFAAGIAAFALPLCGHILGLHFAMLLDALVVPRISKALNYKNLRILELSLVVLGIGGLIANLVLTCTLSVHYWYKMKYSFSILVGSVGTLLRFKLSRYNGRFFKSWFPTGTLMANFIGCLVIAICELLLHGYKHDKTLLITNVVHQFILNGFIAGFSGSITTMSTFMNELYNLNEPLFQHTYFWCTFALCFIVVLLIDGSYAWAVGMRHV